jgi:hypothetical protein
LPPEAVQDGRIHIENINGLFLLKEGGSPAEYLAGLNWRLPVAGCGSTSPALT